MMPECEIASINILMIDDCEDDVFMVQQTFHHLHLLNLMHVARDGEEAFKYLNDIKEGGGVLPGLILLDINMPVMNGYEFLEGVKRNQEFRHIPVAMLTTSDREEDVITSFRHGACSYIRKPVNLEGLLKVMREFEIYWTLVSRRPAP